MHALQTSNAEGHTSACASVKLTKSFNSYVPWFTDELSIGSTSDAAVNHQLYGSNPAQAFLSCSVE